MGSSTFEQKNNGILLIAMAQWVEEGEKNTKYFLNLEKRNYNTEKIKTMISNDGKEMNELSEKIKASVKNYIVANF